MNVMKTPELVLKRGLIYDGTGRPPVYGDIAIYSDYILAMDAEGSLHGLVRLYAMGMEDRRATTDEITSMQQLIREGLREGALGLSTGLIYPPCCYADTAELIELARTVAEVDGIFVAHMRSESDYIED